MSAIDILKGMRELLSDEKRWIKGSNALDSSGWAVISTDPNAVSWCLMGARNRVAHTLEVGSGRYEANVKLSRLVGRCIVEFNDDPATTHADVLSALDKAIADES